MNPLSFIAPGLQIWVRIAALVLLVMAGFGIGWKTNGWRLGTDLQALKAEHQKTIADAAAASLVAQKKVDAEHAVLTDQLASLDSKYHQDLTREQHANDSLRADVLAGRRVVRIAASCSARVAGVPQAAAGGQLDAGAGAVLDPEAGQAAVDLRADAIRIGRKLDACQAALGCLTGQRTCAAAP